MKITKNKIISAVVVLSILAAAWFYGGDYAGKSSALEGTKAVETVQTATPPADQSGQADMAEDTLKGSGEETSEKETQTKSPAVAANQQTGTEVSGTAEPSATPGAYLTDPVPSGKPEPVEPESAEVTEKAHTCTLQVTCKTILDNKDSFSEDKLEVLPTDGVLFPETEVTFYEGESVFNVLQREMKKAGIQMEFEATPIYNSRYIGGIGNIYEYDCGELSGWMYRVNGWFPNYGCSRYQLKDGDAVEWVYTCDYGRDVGGDYAANSGGEG
ncbi:hypothetical protein SDC9_57023 [bioreactor metagenome]|uniref:Transcobalamin-like C-terminal domain-containing protein n=1 Tax=bioreactor metagenome TaxID=1076179 RepID=A0A644X3S7_9ZZZZ